MKLNTLHISFLLLFLSFILASAQENYNTLVYQGNREFNSKNYDDASSKYMEAIKVNGKDFTAHYNLGNALYKKKMYKEAEAEYQKAATLSKNNTDKAAAYYNQGNAVMQNKEHEKAAELYKKALKIDPYNEATRKNYEIAMLKEKEKQNKQQQKNNSGGGGGKGDQKNNQSPDNKDGKTPQQQAGTGQKQQQGQGQGENPEQKDENKGSNMPKDQQNAILNLVGNKERETAKKILNKNAYSMPESNEKDW